MGANRKVFVPLENNPEVMTSLAHALGLVDKLAFYDVYSLDADYLSTSVPRPIYALLFNFPLTPANEDFFRNEESNLLAYKYRTTGAEEPVLFFPQTIGHACGLIGLLHCITNLTRDSPDSVLPDSPLAQLIAQATPLSPPERAQLLYDSPLLESLHAEHAALGSSAPPEDPANWNDGQGFVTFVRGKDGHTWELEGRRKGPIERGKASDGDLLINSVLDQTVQKFIEREKTRGNGDVRFSLIGLGPA